MRYVIYLVLPLVFFAKCSSALGYQNDEFKELLEDIDRFPEKRLNAVTTLWAGNAFTRRDFTYLGDKAIPIFTKALNDSNPDVIRYLCRMLSDFGDKAVPAVPKMGELLSDPNVEVRKSAAMALLHLAGAAKKALPALMNAIKDKDVEVQVYSAGALLSLGRGSDQCLKIITKAMRAEDEKKYHAAEYVGEMVGVPTLPALTICLKDKSPTSLLRATGLLAGAFSELVGKKTNIPDEPVMALAFATKDGDEDVAANAIYALSQGKSYAKKATPHVIDCLKDTRRSVRISAARDLKEFGNSAIDAIPMLRKMAINDTDPIVRREAALSVATLEKLPW